MENTVQQVLTALDQFLIYRTKGKLDELVKVRNKLREQCEKGTLILEEAKHAEQTRRNFEKTAAPAR